jgi:LysM domain
VTQPAAPILPNLVGPDWPQVPQSGQSAFGLTGDRGLSYTLVSRDTTLKFPIAPDTADMQYSMRELAFEPVDMGEAPQPLGPNPKTISFTAWCPGWCRKVEIPEPFVLLAEQVAQQLELWMGDPPDTGPAILLLLISGKYYDPIGMYCYISSFSRKIGDAIGDEMITVNLKEFKPVLIGVEGEQLLPTGPIHGNASDSTDDDSSDRPDDLPQQYTIVEGDTLWDIAQTMYGDGSKWRDIYNANTDVISNPDDLEVGTVITIPGLQPSNAEVMDGVGVGTDTIATGDDQAELDAQAAAAGLGNAP